MADLKLWPVLLLEFPGCSSSAIRQGVGVATLLRSDYRPSTPVDRYCACGTQTALRRNS